VFRSGTPDIPHVVGTSYRDCVRYAEIVPRGPDRPARPHEGVLVRAAGERMNDPELILDAGAELGEGPVWQAPDRVVLWVDITAGLVHRFDPATGRDETFGVGAPVGAVVPTTSGRWALTGPDGFALYDPATGERETLADVEADDPRTRMNDGACDPAGRFWAGTMDVEGRRPIGSLYRLGSDRVPARVLDGVTISNGLAWSPDASTMYYIDSVTHAVDALDFETETGAVAARRHLAEFPEAWGLPDGMTIDEEGFLWVAFWRGSALRRIAPDGRVVATVRFPVSLVTSCAFGGADLSDLYVTSARIELTEVERGEQPTAGGLFLLRPGVRGLPADPYVDAATP
jgi:sugar lactone lactonase YvrE